MKALLLLLLLAGCASVGAGTDQGHLYVDNQSWFDIRVYTYHNGNGYRLGYVNALSEKKWPLSWSDMSENTLNLGLQSLGSRNTFRLEPIYLDLPAEVYLVILYPFQFSYWSWVSYSGGPERVR
jgi:hypothetical protein